MTKEIPNNKIRIGFNINLGQCAELNELIRSSAVDFAKGIITEVPDVFSDLLKFTRSENKETGDVTVVIDWF